MKILMIMHESPLAPGGGLGIHVHNLALQLSKTDNVTVLGNAPGSAGLFSVTADGARQCGEDDWAPQSGAYRLMLPWNQNEHFIAGGIYGEIVSTTNAIYSLARFMPREKFDLIHIHDSYMDSVARYCQIVYRAPLVVTAHLSFYGVSNPQPEHPGYRWGVETERICYNRASRIIAVSNSYRELIEDEMLIGSPVEVIHNGVDAEALEKVIRAQHPFPPSGPKKLTVGFVGRPVDNKGICEFIAAAERCPEFHFVAFSRLVKESTEPGNAEVALKAARSLPNFTWYKDFAVGEHWPLAKAIVDVAVMPSTHEPFGIAALEWMALGKPLIVSNVGGLTEFCNDGNAVVIEPTADAIAAALRSGTWKSAAMVDRARETARAFSWHNTATQTRRVYQEVLNVR